MSVTGRPTAGGPENVAWTTSVAEPYAPQLSMSCAPASWPPLGRSSISAVVQFGNDDEISVDAIVCGVALANVTFGVLSVTTKRSFVPAGSGSKRPVMFALFATARQRAGVGSMSTTRYPAVGTGVGFGFAFAVALGAADGGGATVGGGSIATGALAEALGVALGGGAGSSFTGLASRVHDTSALAVTRCCK